MKNLIFILLGGFFSFACISQSYYINNGNNEYVTIILKESDVHNALSVTKEVLDHPEGTEIQLEKLYLIGDFVRDSYGNLILDYDKYHYYFAPGDKMEPFYWINQEKTIKKGTLYLDTPLMSKTYGDFWYWCSCGGHTPDTQSPGGCLSNLTDNIISCVNDGGCPSGCVGSFVTTLKHPANGLQVKIFKGGGLFIQTDKKHIGHNFNIER
ncbi:MAG: hypothetical protein IT237_00535 [Bacteroidia bacterium]|nr:hypothetical protein [Bacteroidia bacterium]